MMDLEELARRAVSGDRQAVHDLVGALQGDVYLLALRMMWNRQDAEDATQEILVKVVTQLSQFDFRSRLKTWVYRVATNYLLDVKKSRVERQNLSFALFAEDLESGLSTDGPGDDERSLLIEEVKIGCTLGMLQCLDRPHRLAYLLAEVLGLSADEAADALGVEPAALRKRLQRARERIEAFTRAHCGLVSDSAACRCNRRVPAALQLGRARPDALQFAAAPHSFEEARALIRQADGARRALELYRTSRPSDSAVDFARRVLSALEIAGGQR
ncbi:MAG: RNA polymerase sigma factor [Deltaproteobacteria bacterium]|nr:MAG: RNA polymerase sigma factor [Deltaproteobacteria bacterium]